MGILDFLVSVLQDDSEKRWDAILLVAQDLQSSTAPERLNSLQNYVETLTAEIDQVNRKRDAKGQEAANIDEMLPILDGWITDHPDDLEVRLLRDVLVGWRASLKSEIEALRPDTKLHKKYDTERKLDLLTRLRETVDGLNARLRQARDGGVHMQCTPKTKEKARK
jgi:hypothetical protein